MARLQGLISFCKLFLLAGEMSRELKCSTKRICTRSSKVWTGIVDGWTTTAMVGQLSMSWITTNTFLSLSDGALESIELLKKGWRTLQNCCKIRIYIACAQIVQLNGYPINHSINAGLTANSVFISLVLCVRPVICSA